MALSFRPIDRLLTAWHERGAVLKAVSFAMIGVVNVAVDFAVFFVGRAILNASVTAVALATEVSRACDCLGSESWILIPANIISWFVAVSGSYVMNSFITFARESGRRLRPRDYGRFVASGIAGMIANTVTLLIVAQFVPVLAAKGCAILASFLVNFSLSHFVVFRKRERPASDAG